MLDESPSIRVIQKIAALEGVDPVELTPPLYEVIDPDALDNLFAHAQDRPDAPVSTIEFVYRGYTVVVDSTGEIDVTESNPGIDLSSPTGERSIGD